MNELNLNPELNPCVSLEAFEARAGLEQQLCERVCAQLRNALAERGSAALVVSGGRTPAALFQCLSEQPLDWSKVTITLADERWVDNQHEDSNERSVREHLLQNCAAAATFLPLYNGAQTPAAGRADLASALAVLPQAIDAVILGMGEDGHTASFFPGAKELGEALAPEPYTACTAVIPPEAPWPRMTLTLPRLLASAQIFLHLCGEAKLPVLQQALATGEIEAMPVRAVLRQSTTPVAVYWAP